MGGGRGGGGWTVGHVISCVTTKPSVVSHTFIAKVLVSLPTTAQLIVTPVYVVMVTLPELIMLQTSVTAHASDVVGH